MTRLLRAIMFTALLTLLASSAFAVDIDREFHETFPAEPGTRLNLEHGDGDVTIMPWDKDEVEIHVLYKGEVTKFGIGDVKTDFRAEFDVEGKTIYAKGREPGRGTMIGFVSEREIDYRWTVNAPAYVVLEIRGDDGDVRVSGWEAPIDGYLEDGDFTMNDIRGDVRMKMDDGDLTLDGFQGSLHAVSEDGDIVLRQCVTDMARIECDDGEILIDDAEGSFDLESEDGDIEMDRVTVENLAIEADDGRVRLSEIGGRDFDIDIRTQDGDVRLSFVSGVSFEFLVRNDDGPIRIDVGDVDGLKKSEGRVQGIVGSGAGQVRVRSDDGSITLTGDHLKASQ